jgi:hypothetical protein
VWELSRNAPWRLVSLRSRKLFKALWNVPDLSKRINASAHNPEHGACGRGRGK